MQYALFENERVKPAKGKIATCPQCNGEVVAKCGSIKIHHWAHRVKDCDLWSEPETEWHRQWKELVPEACREVTIQNHRADIRLENGTVIEIQHSPISNTEIAEREQFYGDMFWIFDAKKFITNCTQLNVSDISCLKDVDVSELHFVEIQNCLNKQNAVLISKLQQLKLLKSNALADLNSNFEISKWIDLSSLHITGVIPSDWMAKYYNYKTDDAKHIKAIKYIKILESEFSFNLHDLGRMLLNSRYLATSVYDRQWNEEKEELRKSIFADFSLLFKDTFKNSIKNDLDWYKKQYELLYREKIFKLDLEISEADKEQVLLKIKINQGDIHLESKPYRYLNFKLKQPLVVADHTLECPSIEFDWKRPRQSILSVKKPMFWDIDGINLLYLDLNFSIQSHPNKLKCYLIPKNWIVKYILGNNSIFS
jgi:competence CoiA-like predicted nuclease